MKKLQLFSLLFVGFLFWVSCKTTPAVPGDSFGAGVSKPESAITFAEVSTRLDSLDSLNVVVRAKVSEVCQAKGCWMNLVDPTSTAQGELFVQFKDYGFFMPKDLAGKEVIVEGKAYKEQTSVEELKHYAEDAGKSAEEIAAITEPVTEKKFMASGVVLVK
jgi:hypothetical protein